MSCWYSRSLQTKENLEELNAKAMLLICTLLEKNSAVNNITFKQNVFIHRIYEADSIAQ